jgi:uncharacterized membrane protein
MIDVSVETEIDAAPADVAAVMFDPEREPQWMSAVTGVELVDAALAPGARVTHRGRFLGQDLSWSTQVEAVHFPHVLQLRITEGPITGTVRYDIQRGATGSRVRIRNVGEPTAAGFLPAALLAAPLKSALTADLERLKQLVEGAR